MMLPQKVKLGSATLSRSVAIAALAAVALGLLGAAIYLPADNVFEQRLGIVTMLAALVLPALIGAIRSDKGTTVSEDTKQDTAKLLNGELHAAVRQVVHEELVDHDVKVHGLPDPKHAATFHPSKPHVSGVDTP